MRVRRIAVMIDGGFFLRRLPKLVPAHHRTTPGQVAETARHLCKRHVLRLCGIPEEDADVRWLDQVYRLFYYDARPYDGVSHHPLLNRRVEFAKSDTALFRDRLFQELRSKRKFALRLGHVTKESDWRLNARLTKPLLKTHQWLDRIESTVLNGTAPQPLNETEFRDLQKLLEVWRTVSDGDVQLGLRQKGVDMRIGLDIASITLKQQADTIVLVTGDSDFTPAAKLARREGVEFILDPLWQGVADELNEHVDGIISVFPKPANPQH